jgi:hypothetical protein
MIGPPVHHHGIFLQGGLVSSVMGPSVRTVDPVGGSGGTRSGVARDQPDLLEERDRHLPLGKWKFLEVSKGH